MGSTHRLNLLLRAAFIALPAIMPAAAVGCPLCDSAVGRQVRESIFDGQFFARAAAVVAPFPLLLGVVAAIHFGVPRLISDGETKNDQ